MPGAGNVLKVSFGDNVKLLHRAGNRSVYGMEDKTGSGTMTAYDIFPGISVLYNDFHMQACLSNFHSGVPLLGIDHCRAGRIEWELKSGNYVYLQEGDIQISGKRDHVRAFSFPSSHYHGITIGVYVEDLDAPTMGLLMDFSIDIRGLYQRFCLDGDSFIQRAGGQVSRIFSELYCVGDQEETGYMQIKTIELLYLLCRMGTEQREQREYFPQKQVAVVKQIARLITENMERSYTIRELADWFQIPQTTMKRCFRGVYGLPIGQYLRSYRMNAAAQMLREGRASVAAIAGAVGYDNQSKFAAAFRAVVGHTPTGYQRLFVHLD